jgi:hypothetical protein
MTKLTEIRQMAAWVGDVLRTGISRRLAVCMGQASKAYYLVAERCGKRK